MPRDISGNYTLPAGNPVVNGTTIDTTWANPTMSDIAAQLNDVLTRDGLLGPTAAIGFYTGNVAAPGIAFYGDPNTGVWSPAADTWALSTGGTERLRVDSSGNVGVGVTAPVSKLHVGGDIQQDNNTYLKSKTAAGTATRILGINASNTLYFGGVDTLLSGGLSYVNNGAIQLAVNSGGDVGIGTSSPVGKFHVESASLVLGVLRNSTANSYTSLRVYNDQNSSGRSLEIDYAGSTYAGSLVSGGPTGECGSISTTGAYPLVLGTSNTARVIIDTSGNLGVSSAASSWKTGYKAVETSYGSFSTADNATLRLALNSYFGTTGWVNRNTGNSLLFELVNGGGFQWQIAPSAAAGATPTFTTAMTLDSVGQLGIGVTPNAPLSVRKDSSSWEIVRLSNQTVSAGCVLQFNNASTPANGWDIGVGSGDTLAIRRNATAVASFDSAGRMLLNTATVLTGNPALSVQSASQYAATFRQYQNVDYVGIRIENVYAQAAQNATMLQFANSAGAEVGTIKSTGSATTFNTSSDRRLKTNVVPADPSGSVVDSIGVVQYDWAASGTHVAFGVVAQDLVHVFPDAVSVGDSNESVTSPWGVDYSKLVPLLLKEIQDLRARVSVLEAR